MRAVENRKRYERSHLRYPSDLTDGEWQHSAHLLPPAKQGRAKARSQHTRSHQRSHVWAFGRMPVAVTTQGSTAEKHSVPRLRFVEL